jgi:hypothetical protein
LSVGKIEDKNRGKMKYVFEINQQNSGKNNGQMTTDKGL